jgi:hypothetical protein
LSAEPEPSHDQQPGPELASYGRFLAHQLGEVAMLLGAGSATALDGARARIERMLADLHDLYAPLGEVTTCELGEEARAAAAGLSSVGLTVVVSGPDPATAVEADVALLRRLFGHLMRPALATARGHVSFELAAAPAARGRVDVRFSDDAGALDDARAAARLWTADGMSGSGTVLGAGVCGPAATRIVALHGGRISARPGDRGVVMSFDLPAGAA